MKKSTKGMVAAGAAAALLLGGAGTLAYWSDDASVDAGTIASGSLDLSDVTCAGAWTENGQTITKIVPGDTISKSCTGTLTLVGEHIGATVTLTSSSVAAVEAAFNDEVDITASMTSPAATITAPGTYDVTIAITASFPGSPATNVSQNVTQALNGLQVRAVQTHDDTP